MGTLDLEQCQPHFENISSISSSLFILYEEVLILKDRQLFSYSTILFIKEDLVTKTRKDAPEVMGLVPLEPSFGGIYDKSGLRRDQ